MVLIAMCVYSTEDNQKDECLEKTLLSLKRTVDLKKHRLFLSVNGKTEKTLNIINSSLEEIDFTLIENEKNLGTAKGINKCWVYRKEGEHCLKIDDDIVIDSPGWLEVLEEALSLDENIGQIGLKRTDLSEDPNNPNNRSTLISLPHTPGKRWIHVEKVDHVIGSCVLHSAKLIKKTGGLFQGDDNLYGFDDCLKSYISILAGFYNCFWPHILIHHIDNRPSAFRDWKRSHASKNFPMFQNICKELKNGTRKLYFDF